MALTGSQFVTVARRALGDRDTIGDETSLNDAVVYAVNSTIKRLAAERNWHAMQKLYTSNITSADYLFSLPANTKSMLGAWLVVDSAGHLLQYVSKHRKDDVFPETNSTINSTRPCYIGRQNATTFWVHPHPDQSYKIYMRCSIWPADITINSAHTLGDRLDQVIAAGAIAELHRQLQEPEDAAAWEGIYRRQMNEQIAAEKEKPDWTPSDSPSRMGSRYLKPGNYLTSPWYRLRR